MEVIIPKHSGFCPGVKSAEKQIFQKKREIGDQTIYVYGYMINNKLYIDHLKNLGIESQEDRLDFPEGALVAIRTHGIDRNVEARLQKRFELIDLTCPNVKKVQKKIHDYAEKDFYILINGKKSHPEVEGLISYSKDFYIIETRSELDQFLKSSEVILAGSGSRPYQKILIVSQTTGSRELFKEIILKVKAHLSDRIEVQVFDSICPVTERKEAEALSLQKEADLTFVIGDRLSSNAEKLYKRLADQGDAVYFIENMEDMRKLGLKPGTYRKALVVSSASTPSFVEDEVAAYLRAIPGKDSI